MPSIDIVLELSADQCRSYYAGRILTVQAQSTDGRWVRLPARALQQLVDGHGIRGVYRLTYGDDGRFRTIEKLSAL